MIKRIFITLIVLIAVSLCVSAWSEPNSKQPIPQGKSGKLTKQKRTEQITPPPDVITTQQLIDAISHAIEAAADKAKTTQNPSPPDDSSRFSFWLVIFTGGLVLVGGIQCYIIFRTLEETKKAANAADESAKVAKTALHVAERAYLSVDNYKFHHTFKIGNNPTISYKIINVGHTPAQITETAHFIDILDEIPVEPDYSKCESRYNKFSIRPSSKITRIASTDEPIIAGQIKCISDNTKFLAMWGMIKYRDIFKNSFVVGFGVRYNPLVKLFAFIDGYNYIVEDEQDNKES